MTVIAFSELIAKHESTIAKHESTIVKLETTIQELRESNTKHESTIQEHKSTIQELRETIQELKSTIQEHGSTIQELRESNIMRDTTIAKHETTIQFLLQEARERRALLAFRDWKYLFKRHIGVPQQKKMPEGTKLGDATRAAINALSLDPVLKATLCSFFPNSDPDHEDVHIALTADQIPFGLSATDLLKFMSPISKGLK